MTIDLATVVGFIGSGLMMVAYAYSNAVKAVDFVLFNALNLVGAVLLCWSLTVHVNLASLLLEIAWVVIAAFGLGRALLARRRA